MATTSAHVAVAMVSICLAIVLVAWQLRRPNDLTGWNRVWLDFRDSFGVVWAMRVAERVNQSAAAYAWSVRLRWNGFQGIDQEENRVVDSTIDRDTDAPLAGVAPEQLDQAVRTLLRRFVSPDWIDQRMGRVEPSTSRDARFEMPD